MIAVYIDNALERYSHEIKYTFDFIFSTLGYEFKYINRIRQFFVFIGSPPLLLKKNRLILYICY